MNRSSQATEYRVLLLGYRAGLARALKALRVPYVVWNEKPLKAPPRDGVVHVAPFGQTAQTLRRQAAELQKLGPFTHVIGGTEASVVAASYARRVLGARLSTHTTAHRCHDKLQMKSALSQHGVPMTDFVDGNQSPTWPELHERLGSPLIVKNRRSAGGTGIDVVRGEQDHNVSLRHRMIERFVDAPEASVESFVFKGQVVFENVTEYYRKQHINIVPASSSVDRPGGIRQVSRRVIDLLRINWGLTHMEAFLCPDQALFGEIALRPPGGYIMELISLAYDFDAWKGFVSVELELPFYFPEEASACAAVVILHPGAGRVTRVSGLKKLAGHPHVVRASLQAKVGDRIDARSSVAKNVGHVILRAPDREAVMAAIDEVERTLKIELDTST